MLLAGLIVAAVGVLLVFNVARTADGLAAIARPWPAWLRGWAGDNPANYRLIGAGFLALAIVMVGRGIRLW